MTSKTPEQIYLFRHAVVRDTAYSLQLPRERAALHELALEALENMLTDEERAATATEMAAHAEFALNATATANIGHLRRQHEKYLKLAARHAESQFQNGEAEQLHLVLAEVLPRDECAGHFHAAGDAARLAGRMDAARRHLEAALAMARQQGDRAMEGKAMGSIALVKHQTGYSDEALELYDAAIGVLREAGRRKQEGNVTSNRALLLNDLGRYDEAVAGHRAALEIHREVGNRSSEARTMGNLASTYKSLGRMEEASELHDQTLKLHRETGDRRSEGIQLGNIGNLYRGDESGKAEDYYRRALDIHDEVGNRRSGAIVLTNHASHLQTLGRVDESEALLERALVIHREVGNRRFEAIVLGLMAGPRAARGELEPAAGLLERAVRMSREIGDLEYHLKHAAQYAVALARLGDWPRAQQARDEARQLAGDARRGDAVREELELYDKLAREAE